MNLTGYCNKLKQLFSPQKWAKKSFPAIHINLRMASIRWRKFKIVACQNGENSRLSLVKMGKGRKAISCHHIRPFGTLWTCPENSQNSNKTLKKSSIWITHTIGSVLSPLPIQRSRNLHKEASLKSPDKIRWMSIVEFQRAHQFESDTIYWPPSLAIEL